MSPASSSQSAQLIQGLYDAFARGDVPAVLGAFAPDIEWNEAENFAYADGNPYRGPQAILTGVFARLASEWEGFSVVPESFVAEGDRVAVTGRYRGSFRQTGKTLNAQFVHVWTTGQDKVRRFQQYTDTLQFARIMGRLQD